jgi:hypothetical protein
MDLLVDRKILSITDGCRRGGPFPYPIEGEDDGLLKRRRVESRGGVAQMVLAESQATIPVEIGLNRLEFVREQRLLK